MCGKLELNSFSVLFLIKESCPKIGDRGAVILENSVTWVSVCGHLQKRKANKHLSGNVMANTPSCFRKGEMKTKRKQNKKC